VILAAEVVLAHVAWRRVGGSRPAVIVSVTAMPSTRPRSTVIGGGAVGLGEATPLPGRSADDADSVERALAAVAARAPIAFAALAAVTSPAARFALETAALDAVAQERGVALAELLAPSPARVVPINALVEDAAAARRAVDRGIRTVKVKIRDDGLLAIAAVRDAVGRDIALRADVNRGWSAADAPARLRALVGLGLEYVEEPCHGARAIAAASPIPIALDETVEDDGPDVVLGPGVAVLVVKPTLVGGIARTLALARRARAAGVDVVVTHALEGPIALAACAELARAIAGPRAVGLDAHPGLERWARTRVPQLGPAAVTAAPAPGLGLDRAAVLADLEDVP
jgi:o-succinylbenzoate synthase